MLVEDTLPLSEEITDILRLEGYLVSPVNNAIVALELISIFNPDLVITDLLMPGIDGFDLIKKIRIMTPFVSIPIIIFSAKISASDKLYGSKIGANAFIQKPCKANELISCIISLLK
jgi:DNA-binding response OmpR family regulator